VLAAMTKNHRCSHHQGLRQHAAPAKNAPPREKPAAASQARKASAAVMVARSHRPPRVCLVGNSGADEGDVQDGYRRANNGFGPTACSCLAIARLLRLRRPPRKSTQGASVKRPVEGRNRVIQKQFALGPTRPMKAHVHRVLQDEVCSQSSAAIQRPARDRYKAAQPEAKPEQGCAQGSHPVGHTRDE